MDNIKLQEKLKAELSDEKIKFVEKYSLEINSRRQWITRRNNTPERLYFSHKFISQNNILIIDLRYLQQIRKVEDFLELIEWLENFKK